MDLQYVFSPFGLSHIYKFLRFWSWTEFTFFLLDLQELRLIFILLSFQIFV